MSKNLKIKTMNWNYISGFFDADGSTSLVSVHKNEPKTIQISFHNTKLNILKEIQSFIYTELGIKGFISTKQAKKENHKTSYDLKYTRFSKCLKIIENLEIYHPMKIHRFNISKQIYEYTPRNGKYTQDMLNKREILIEEYFSF